MIPAGLAVSCRSCCHEAVGQLKQLSVGREVLRDELWLQGGGADDFDRV